MSSRSTHAIINLPHATHKNTHTHPFQLDTPTYSVLGSCAQTRIAHGHIHTLVTHAPSRNAVPVHEPPQHTHTHTHTSEERCDAKEYRYRLHPYHKKAKNVLQQINALSHGDGSSVYM